MKLQTLVTALAFLLGCCSMMFAQDSDDKKADAIIQVKIQDGKVVLTNEKGETKEIDLGDFAGSGSQKIIVQEVESINGKTRTKWNHGILVEGDGEVQVIELEPSGSVLTWESDQDGDGKAPKIIDRILPGRMRLSDGTREGRFELDFSSDEDLKDLGGTLRAFVENSDNKYMIGVACEPISDSMRAQLKLDEKSGLIVTNVFEDSPASKSFKNHDIIVKANGKLLTSNAELSAVVQESGKQDSKLEVQTIREGDSLIISVKPTERKTATFELAVPEMDEDSRLQLRRVLGDLKESGDFKLIKPGSGIVMPRFKLESKEGFSTERADLLQQIAELRKQVEALQKLVEEKDR